MQFLVEKKINFNSPKDENTFERYIESNDKSEVQKALKIFIKALQKNYPEQFKHINSTKSQNNYLSAVLNSVITKGTDTNNNPLLDFALSNKNTFDISKDNIQVLNSILNNNLINNTTTWIHDPKAYDGDSTFKLKALAYLSSQEDHSTTTKNTFTKLLNIKKERDIKQLMQSWQQLITKSQQDFNSLQRLLDNSVSGSVDDIPSSEVISRIEDEGYEVIYKNNKFTIAKAGFTDRNNLQGLMDKDIQIVGNPTRDTIDRIHNAGFDIIWKHNVPRVVQRNTNK